MDFQYLIVAGARWAIAFGLALGCERLQSRAVTP